MSNRLSPVISVLMLVVLFLFSGPPAGAFEKKVYPRFGLSAVLQDEQTAISVPIWTQWQFVVNPSIYFIHVNDAFTDAGLGLQFKYVLKKGRAVPFVGVDSRWYFYSPGYGDVKDDYALGPVFGGEYFFDDHFSIGVEARVMFFISEMDSERFYDTDETSVATSTAVRATYYF